MKIHCCDSPSHDHTFVCTEQNICPLCMAQAKEARIIEACAKAGFASLDGDTMKTVEAVCEEVRRLRAQQTEGVAIL